VALSWVIRAGDCADEQHELVELRAAPLVVESAVMATPAAVFDCCVEELVFRLGACSNLRSLNGFSDILISI
jgi:hypothetical protein